VRFCDISKYVKDSDRQAEDAAISHPGPASLSTELSLVEPTEKVGENEELELEGRLWEDDDDDDDEEEEENPVLNSARETASSTSMDIEVDRHRRPATL
jgi:hypothetical protein